MAPETYALLGVALGALLAGGGNLLLDWRTETLQSRAGVHLIRVILDDAIKEVERLTAETTPRWGRSGSLPDSREWEPYRVAVSARLPLNRLLKVDKAMHRLDTLNAAAAAANHRAAELETRIWDAGMRNDDAAVQVLTRADAPEILSEPALRGLNPALADFRDALEGLTTWAPLRQLDEGRRPRHLRPWVLWHLRPILLALGLVVVAAVAAGVLRNSSPSETTTVEKELSARLDNEALTACGAVEDHEGRFSCIAVENAQGTSCAGAALVPQLVADRTPVAQQGDPQCDALTRAIQWSADRQSDGDCTAFTETAEAEVPPKRDQSKEGFLARLKRKLSRGSSDRTGLPPVIVPGSAFVAC